MLLRNIIRQTTTLVIKIYLQFRNLLNQNVFYFIFYLLLILLIFLLLIRHPRAPGFVPHRWQATGWDDFAAMVTGSIPRMGLHLP